MKTAINIFPSLPEAEMLPLIANAGFDGCFCGYRPERTIREAAQLIRQHGLIFQSVHAPFNKCNKLWEEGEEGDAFLDVLTDCARQTADAGVPIMVAHVWISFVEPHPNQIGIDRFGKLLAEAEKLGITVALENTEGEEYLEHIKKHLWSSPAVGFCIDTGHEMCYNRSQDMIGKYGDKLVCTHLNDNLGITTEKIFWHDDAHLFPFDGIADWQGIADRLKKIGYKDILTFELTDKNKPGRTTHDRYAHLSMQEMMNLAHEKAVQFAKMME